MGEYQTCWVTWELGLSEAHQALVKNNMRHKVLLEVDGGLRSAKDVLVGSFLVLTGLVLELCHF